MIINKNGQFCRRSHIDLCISEMEPVFSVVFPIWPFWCSCWRWACLSAASLSSLGSAAISRPIIILATPPIMKLTLLRNLYIIHKKILSFYQYTWSQYFILNLFSRKKSFSTNPSHQFPSHSWSFEVNPSGTLSAPSTQRFKIAPPPRKPTAGPSTPVPSK